LKPGVARGLRTSTKALAIAGVILAVLAVRVVTASQAELAEARMLEGRGDVDASIVHYRRAATWYAPGNPFSTDALDRLLALGASAAEEGDRTRALLAYRSARGAILSARSFYTPHGERLAHANHAIADLLAAEEPPPIDAGKSPEELRREHLALLERTARPKIGWTVLLLFGFAAWVSGAFAFATCAIDDEDRLVAVEARKWGTVFVVGFGLFVLGMALA
jgi:hypothetical protein